MDTRRFTAFSGHRCIATGPIEAVLLAMKKHVDRGEGVLVFEDGTGQQIDFDVRGTPGEALARLASHPLFAAARPATRSGPGRPKLGVVSREVSLLPRHWEWLAQQRGGISAALRTLVDEARKRGQYKHLARKAREAAGKFMWTMGGDLSNFEEASRALYAKEDARLKRLVREWPKDVSKHALRLVDEAARLDALAAAEAAKANAAK